MGEIEMRSQASHSVSTIVYLMKDPIKGGVSKSPTHAVVIQTLVPLLRVNALLVEDSEQSSWRVLSKEKFLTHEWSK